MKRETDFFAASSLSGEIFLFLVDKDWSSRLAFKRLLLTSTLENLSLPKSCFEKALEFSENLIRDDADRAAQNIE